MIFFSSHYPQQKSAESIHNTRTPRVRLNLLLVFTGYLINVSTFSKHVRPNSKQSGIPLKIFFFGKVDLFAPLLGDIEVIIPCSFDFNLKKKKSKKNPARLPLLKKSCGGQPNNHFFRPYGKNFMNYKLIVNNLAVQYVNWIKKKNYSYPFIWRKRGVKKRRKP